MKKTPTKGKNKRRAQASVQSPVIASKQRVAEDVPAPDPDQFIKMEMMPLFVEEADRIDEVYLHNRNVLHRRIARRQQNVLQRLQKTVQVENKKTANKKVEQVISLCTSDEETIEAVASPVASAVASETSTASASKIPVATASHSCACTQQWEREFSERLVMIRRIHSRQPSSGVLDPFPCRNRVDCPFTTGSLMSQRYSLMERLYQINQTIYGKSDPSMDRNSLGNTLI